MDYLLSVVALLLGSLVIVALVFNPSFRHDILGAEGEAEIKGLFTVRGVAVIGLVAILLGAAIVKWPDVEFSEESAFVDVALRSGEASMVLKVRNASASAISDANRILDKEWIPLFVRNYLRIIADELSDIDRTSLEGQASCNDRGGNPSGGGTTSRSDASGYFVKMGSLDSAWIAAPPRWRSVLIVEKPMSTLLGGRTASTLNAVSADHRIAATTSPPRQDGNIGYQTD